MGLPPPACPVAIMWIGCGGAAWMTNARSLQIMTKWTMRFVHA